MAGWVCVMDFTGRELVSVSYVRGCYVRSCRFVYFSPETAWWCDLGREGENLGDISPIVGFLESESEDLVDNSGGYCLRTPRSEVLLPIFEIALVDRRHRSRE